MFFDFEIDGYSLLFYCSCECEYSDSEGWAGTESESEFSWGGSTLSDEEPSARKVHVPKGHLVRGGVRRFARAGDETKKQRKERLDLVNGAFHLGNFDRAKKIGWYFQDVSLSIDATNCMLVGMTLAQFKDWKVYKDIETVVVDCGPDDWNSRAVGYTHEASFNPGCRHCRGGPTLVRMSREDFEEWAMLVREGKLCSSRDKS